MGRRNAGATAGRVALWGLATIVLVLIGSWVWGQLQHLGTAERKTAQHVVRVQVLNGSGEPGVGVRIASYLREGGFQVTQVANADRSDYFASMVVARRDDLSLAREVAHYLGSPPVIRQGWSADETADVTVVIGSDRSRLEIGP